MKTNYGSKEVDNVIESVSQAYTSLDSYTDIANIWSAGFFFAADLNLTPEMAVKRCASAIKRFSDSANGFHRFTSNYLPSCIVILGKMTLLLRRGSGNVSPTGNVTSVNIRAFDHGRLSPAIMLSELFSHMHSLPQPDSRRTNILSMIERAGIKCVLSKNVRITP